jgi:putative Ca2+/H+ antiporter (TMEM165/GDT1 family)
MLDHQMTNAVFYGSAIALVLSVVSAVIVGDGVSKKTKSHLAAA